MADDSSIYTNLVVAKQNGIMLDEFGNQLIPSLMPQNNLMQLKNNRFFLENEEVIDMLNNLKQTSEEIKNLPDNYMNQFNSNSNKSCGFNINIRKNLKINSVSPENDEREVENYYFDRMDFGTNNEERPKPDFSEPNDPPHIKSLLQRDDIIAQINFLPTLFNIIAYDMMTWLPHPLSKIREVQELRNSNHKSI